MKKTLILILLLGLRFFCPTQVYSQNNLCSQEFKIWNAGTGQFENILREDLFYDSFGKLVQFQFLYWDTLTGSYTLYSQGLLTYSGNSEPSYILGQSFNAAANTWNNLFQVFYEYDINGNRIKDSIQDYDTLAMAWMPFRFRELFFYNASNYNIGQVNSEWDTGGFWLNIDSSYRILDSSGLTLEYYNDSWNPNLNIWDKSFKVVDNYQGGKIIDSVYQSWNGSTYINNVKTHFEYNVNGKLFIKSAFYWDATSSTWAIDLVDSFFYDINNNLDYDILYSFDNNNVQWIPWWRIDYAYGSCLFTGLSEVKSNDEIVVYPNPCITSVNFYFADPLSNATIRFLTISGQSIYEASNLTGKTFLINMSNLSNGIYIGEVIEKGQMRRVKLVKNN